MDLLTSLLKPFRNRDAALTLAVFLARFWSAPGRLVLAFPIDRRALADHAELGLTEARVRGAITTLELIGFLDRATVPSGSRYKPTPDGLHRKPVLWQFGSEFLSLFEKAHQRARAAQAPRPSQRPPLPASQKAHSFTAVLAALPPSSPKNKNSPDRSLLMGDLQKSCPGTSLGLSVAPDPIAPRSPLDDALARFEIAFRGREGGSNA